MQLRKKNSQQCIHLKECREELSKSNIRALRTLQIAAEFLSKNFALENHELRDVVLVLLSDER